ncbi:PadR family transcriptional regulator [Leekyejoonella antrihumi]|uniref:Helix-turn-helix transcriptional regulator n=1 Tax=Leekyejoonella antrihumi TaxID=1660198 RepID=A0A563DZ55_9MICO|nr:PadR family transcriptional regulator [Leekyejoonella antrihumi]TWP35252.1 helix-turn-helix transcriptional regulator [Leekyejoonella antrihumi]
MSPVFAHGQLRLYLLALLADGPRHGYEVMRDLEERFHGLYTPSAGTIYPRLAKLEEEGLVERSMQGRKGTYALTEQGREEVASRRADLGDLEQDLDQSVHDLAAEVRSRVHGQSSDLRNELKAAAKAARRTAVPIGADTGPISGGRTDALVEEALQQLRRAARRVTRARSTTEQTRQEALAVITEAVRRMQELADR